MYALTIRHTFSGAHALLINGVREPLHGHDFRVTLTIASLPPHELQDGMLCDFHAAHAALVDACGPFHNANLNEVPPFNAGVNPSAELIARTLHERLTERLASVLGGARGGASGHGPRAMVASVEVSESPGCTAIYAPGR